eukprot:483721_1
MASPTLINQTLMSLIESAECIQDLIPFLKTLFGVQEMKDIIKHRLSTRNISQKRDLHLKVSPMDELLPHHIIQYLVGFNDDLRHIALVNKTFHKGCNSSQRVLLRQQQTDWEKEFNALHSDFTNKNRIINVYPSPHHNTLSLAIAYAQSGDTLLIHQGVYQFQEYYQVNKNIKLIGYGPNVIIKQEDNTPPETESDETHIVEFNAEYTYVQNIRFEVDNSWLCINASLSSFYMENCVIFSNWMAIELCQCKTVKIKNCVVEGDLLNVI